MNEAALQLQIRKFLKKSGITSQREIEIALRTALDRGQLAIGDEIVADMQLSIDILDLNVNINDKIKLD